MRPRHFSLFRVTTISVLAGGALLAVPAYADPVTLVCINEKADYTWTFKLDIEAHTANGFAATVTADTVTWFDTGNRATYTLDRVSGVLSISAGPSYTCRRGERQF